MKNGFSFKGVHSSTFEGVTVKTKDRPIMPSVKASSYAADNMHGEYDFSDYTGRTFYEMRTIQLDITVTADNLRALQSKLNRLSLWLTGKGYLIFDDIPSVQWEGKVADSISYMPEHGGKKALLAVSFLCQPFSESIFDAFDGPRLGDKIPLGAHIMLGAREYLTLGAGTETIACMGDVAVEPVIHVSDGECTISINGKSITVSYTGGAYVIDCKKKQVYDSGGKSLMTYTTGDFPVLVCDSDNVVETDGKIEIHYRAKYLYNGGLS